MQTVHEQKRLLTQASQLEEISNPVIYRMMMVTICCLVLFFTLWAAVTDIHEIARAPGEVVPDGYIKVVQHLEGGIVDQILVHEGERVKAGQVLMVLNGEGLKEDLLRTSARQTSLMMQEERLRAFMEGRNPDFSKFGKVDPELLKDQNNFYQTMKDAHLNDADIIRQQIAQKEQALRSLMAQAGTEKEKYDIERSLHEKRTALYNKGFYSEARYLQSKQSMTATYGQMQQVYSRIAETKAEIAEFNNRLKSLSTREGDTTNERLDSLIAEKEQNNEQLKKLKDRVARLEIKSPVDGYVKGVAVTTIGAVIKPAETLMEIVPADEKMMVQVQIQPQYVARLKIGQPVNIKVSSYDFSKDGYVTGELEQLSAATFETENGQRYYQGRVSLDHEYVGDNAKNTVLPGMTVMAEIVTGKKSILQYLLKPVHNSLRTAFTEK